jgi:hypothetical protein
MIYSRWRPDTGGYDYYDVAERRGLGDDLPVPRRGFSAHPIGTASVKLGRVPSGKLREVGSGAEARGMVLPTSAAGLASLPLVDRLGPFVIGTLAFFGGVAFADWHRRR